MTDEAVLDRSHASSRDRSGTAGVLGRIDEFAVPALFFAAAVVFPFASGISNGPRAIAGPLRWLILLAFLLVELPHLLRGPRGWLRSVGFDAYHLVWAAFLAFAALSAVWSLAPASSFKHAVSVGLLAVAALVTVWRYASTDLGRRRLGYALFAGAGIVLVASLLVGLADPSLGRQTDLGSHIVRWRGIFENPNELGLEGVLLMPVAAAVTVASRGWLRVAALACGALAFLLMALSGTRSSVAVGVLVVIAFAALHGHRGKAVAAGTAAVVLAVVAASVLVATGHGHFLRLDTTSTLSGRTEAWKWSWHEVRHGHLVGGFGFATEPEVIERIKKIPVKAPHCVGDCIGTPGNGPFKTFAGGHVESSYVGGLAQLGLIGVALLAAQILVPLAAIAMTAARNDPWLRALGLLFAGGAIVAITESYLWSAGNFATFPVWAGAAVVTAAWAHQRRSAAA